MRAAIPAFLGGLVAVGVFLAVLHQACKLDLRFCPGPVACQVWQS